MDLVLREKVVTIIFVYGPQSGRREENKNCFHDDLSAKVQLKNGSCIVRGNLYGHVGNSIDRYEGVLR